MSSRRKKSSPETTHAAVTASGTGTALTAQGMKNISVQIVATSVSSGGVFALEGSLDGTSFGVLTPKTTAAANLAVSNRLFTVSANGTYILEYENVSVKDVHVNLSTRTDGTYTVKVWMSD